MPASELAPQSIFGQAATVFDDLDVALSTRTEYKWRVQTFFSYLADKPLTIQSYLEYKRYLQSRTDLSVSTKNKYLVAARIFLRELTRRGLLPTDITLNVRVFKQSKKHRQDGLNDQDMARLSEWLRSLPDTRTNARLKAIVCLLALQGLRQIEVCRLNVADLDLVAQVAHVQGKGRDDREPVDLNPQTVQAIREYLKTARVADGPLFPSWHRSGRYNRLTPRHVRRIIRQALDGLGIDKTTHGFRHWFTTQLLDSYGGDLLEVRQYTRHAGIETLRIYDDRRKQKEDLPRFYNAFKEVVL
jgi:integrase/recombinase XerC